MRPPGPPPAAGTAPAAAAARAAASVILLRDGPDGIEAWLLRRVRRMAFAAGMTVFPGGRVDERDRGDDVAWAGDQPERLAAAMGVSVPVARASMVAAVRETFEETGVLLTRPPLARPDADTARWLGGRRREVEAGRRSFAALLDELALAVDATSIRPWSRWVTPVEEARRYDTCFYVAALPAGSEARPETTEAEHGQWLRAAHALSEYEAGRRPMLPPTIVTLRALTAFDRVADVLAASSARSLEPVRPRVEVRADGVRTVVLPDGETFVLAGPTGLPA